MAKEQQKIKAFVTEWTDKTVTYNCFEIGQTRFSDLKPLFDGMKLFKGKNIWFETEIIPGIMTIKNNESKKNRFIQLWNYYVHGKF
jgi:hypothetical protein